MGYNSMFAARFISGMPHGARYGVSALVAASMVSPQHKARYIGYVMLGLAVANVAGVPLVTWAGQTLGWRIAFWMVAAGLVLTSIMVMLFVPSVAADRSASPLKKELGALKSPQILMTFAVASSQLCGHVCRIQLYHPGADESCRVFNLSRAMDPGSPGGGHGCRQHYRWQAGGHCADPIHIWHHRTEHRLSGPVYPRAHCRPRFSSCCLCSGADFRSCRRFQAHMMNIAGEAQTLASSLTHSAFNISNALGAAAGGFVIASGGSWISTGWVGAAFFPVSTSSYVLIGTHY